MNENKMVAVKNLTSGVVFRLSRTNTHGVTRLSQWYQVATVSDTSPFYIVDCVDGSALTLPALAEVEVQS